MARRNIVTRRWVRFELPVMVGVDIDDDVEHEQVATVVLGGRLNGPGTPHCRVASRAESTRQ
jgi:hypothetical protein